ncbi:MAG: hypothetical protein KGM44_01445 [bacterium]|nr:hypothetical protein [bacterium]
MGWMYLFFPLLALVATAIHLGIERRSRNGAGLIEALLLYSLVFIAGLQGLWTAGGHVFIANQVAAMIGWPAGSPFQFEVGIANLAIGVLGVLCIWMRGNFWAATVIAASVWLWGDAVGHVREIALSHNFALGSAGPALFAGILTPAVLIALLIAHVSESRRAMPYVRSYR